MGKRALTGENTRKRAAAAVNQAVKNTTVTKKTDNQQTKSKSNNNTMTRKRNQVLFNKEVYTPRNNYRREDDDINEDIETNYARSTGSIDMAELIELFQSKTKKRSSSRFDKFEHEQGDRIEKAREMIDGESGIITIWATEMEKITSNVKRKTDDRLERENEYIKKLKFEFEKYQSVTTKTLDNLTKLHSQSQKLGRDIDNNLRQLYETDETELNEALEQFIKQQNYVHKILLHTNKKDHDITSLQKRLSEC